MRVLSCGARPTGLHVAEGPTDVYRQAVTPRHEVAAEVISCPDPGHSHGQSTGSAFVAATDKW